MKTTIRIFVFIFLTSYAFGQGVFVHQKDYSLTPTSIGNKFFPAVKFQSFTIFPMDTSKTGLPVDFVSRAAGESSISGIVTSLNELTTKQLYEIEDIMGSSYRGYEIYIDLADKYKNRNRNRTCIVWLRPKD